MSMQPNGISSLEQINNFWVREFALYLHEHRDPRNRRTHMFGIPILLLSAAVGLLYWNWFLIVGGQIVGWAIQLLGHRFEGNRPALLKRPISFLMGPLMVGAEMLEHLGIHFQFVEKAQQHVGFKV